MTPDRSRMALERALRAPAYASWRPLDPGPSERTAARFERLPVLTKADLRRDFPAAFVPPGVDLKEGLARGQVEFVATSGTTGEPMQLLWDQRWWDASERASWQLNAHARRLMTGTHREAVLASPRCVGPPPKDRPTTQQERTLGRLLFLNEHADVAKWSDADVVRMVTELEQHHPVVLEADPVYLAAFCRRARALGLVLFQPQLLVFTYSYPSRAHLRQVQQSFHAPTMSSHGSTECGYVFVECEHGRLHQNVASCHVDFLPFSAPGLGRLIVTPFEHPWYCVLRFDIGDLGLLSDAPCACGNRDGLTLEAIAGRTDDVTSTLAGRLVSVREVDLALSAVEGLWSYRLDQPGPGRYALRLLSDRPEQDVRSAREALLRLYGAAAEVRVQVVEALPPERSGKYRLAVASTT